MPKTKACAELKPAANMHPAYYHLHALLQTVRQLGTHEDEICSLLSELQHKNKPSAALRRELDSLLAELPLHRLTAEVERLEQSVHQAA